MSVTSPSVLLVVAKHLLIPSSCTISSEAKKKFYCAGLAARPLQRDLNMVSSVRRLSLNRRKCLVLRFAVENKYFYSLGADARYYLDGVQLEFVDSCRD